MNFLDKMQRKYGKYAIHNLMLYILFGNAFVFLFHYISGGRLLPFITFDLRSILNGQVWRLITFIFIPNTMNYGTTTLNIMDIIFFAFSVFLYYSISRELEYTWGAFKFNVYYFLGVLVTIITSSLFNIEGTTLYINLSLFLAYATLFPNVQFLLYGLLPIKVKYLAWLSIAIYVSQIISSPSIAPIIIISLLNYFLFFGIPFLKGKKTPAQRNFNKQKRDYKPSSGAPIKVAFHKCHVCGKTEVSDPDMEFRYCSTCTGNYEYCMDHIKNHEHVK